MEAIRLHVHMKEKATLDRISVAKEGKIFSLHFRKIKGATLEDGYQLIASLPDTNTMKFIGFNTYEEIKKTKIHYLRFRNEEGAVINAHVSKISIVFPSRKDEEVVLWEKPLSASQLICN